MTMVNIILDTDLGRDCDDAGALALLHTMADLNKASILAITLCTSEISSAVTVKMINEWYKRPEIPIGRYTKRSFLEEEVCKRFTMPLMQKYCETHSMPRFESSVRVLRKALAQNSNVVIASIGMMNNIAELLKSPPDDISPLSGIELVRKSVKEMYAMGGNFKDGSYAEYNIVTDVQSAKFVSKNMPVPIIYCGFEIGEKIKSGTALLDADDNNPVKFAYLRHCTRDKIPHFSWDPITVYCAAEPNNALFKTSEGLNITFGDDAKTIICGDGKDRYIIRNAPREEIQKTIDGLIRR